MSAVALASDLAQVIAPVPSPPACALCRGLCGLQRPRGGIPGKHREGDKDERELHGLGGVPGVRRLADDVRKAHSPWTWRRISSTYSCSLGLVECALAGPHVHAWVWLAGARRQTNQLCV
jgi:hypothetical protein